MVRTGAVILAHGHALAADHLRVLIHNVVQRLASHASNAILTHYLQAIVVLIHVAAIEGRIEAAVAIHTGGVGRSGGRDSQQKCWTLPAGRPICGALAARLPPVEVHRVQRQHERGRVDVGGRSAAVFGDAGVVV